MATCAEIADLTLADSEAEDSFSMLPLLKGTSGYKREATVHHSINGSFAIRKDEFKLVLCPGSGGWSHPRPNMKGIEKLPELQLFNLANDPAEKENIYEEHPEKVAELKNLLVTYIENGRSTWGGQTKKQPFEHCGQTVASNRTYFK